MPSIPARLAQKLSWIYSLLLNKYGFDAFNNHVIIPATTGLGNVLYKVGDQRLIDGFVVNGSSRVVNWFGVKGRLFQSGYLYHYVTVMVFGLLGFLCWLILG
jgi:NADH-quinone oxidoreductase subunit L